MSPDMGQRRARRWWNARGHVGLIAAGACGLLLATTTGALAAERAYELVSPPRKGMGGLVLGLRAADDGNALAYYLNAPTGPQDGAYVSVPFVSWRTDSGWEARSAAPPVRAEHRGSGEVRGFFREATGDFRKIFLRTNDPIDPDDKEPMEEGHPNVFGWDLYRFDPLTRQADWVSRPAPEVADDYGTGSLDDYVTSTADGNRILFSTRKPVLPDVPPTTLTGLYEAVRGRVRLVAILPDGRPAPQASRQALGTLPLTNWERRRSAMSEDGSRIYWTTQGHLYLREDGVRTIPVSASQRTDNRGTMMGATFLGMTPDGATAFIHSNVALTDDAPSRPALYRWDRATERLTYLAELQGPLTPSGTTTPYVSTAGDRIYLYASGVHADGALAGQRNLYLWDGRLRLVAATPTSAPTSDPRLRVTPDGSVAVFTSRRPIAPRFEAVHRNGVNAIYRYDANMGEVDCVSCRADGPSESEALLAPTIARYSAAALNQAYAQPRNITADGRRVYFQTEEPLVPEDTNGNLDVYGWEDGRHVLISNGKGFGAEIIDNSDDGRTVFFMTAESLVSADADGGYPDAYAARIDGGFPEPLPPPPGCQGDNCQGPLAVPPVFDAPGSALGQPDDSADDRPPITPSFRPLRPKARQLRTFAGTGRIVVRVRVGTPGSLMLVARGRIGRRERTLGRAWRRVARRGTARMTVSLPSAARRQLSAGKALPVRVTVRHSLADETAKSIVLRLKAPRRAARRAAATSAGRPAAGR